MTTNSLALIEASQYDIMSKLAKIAVGSSYVAKNETQALFIMLKGFELGISPMQALDGITVIQNKTTVSPQLMLALINRSGELADIAIDSSDRRAIVTMTRKGRTPHTETFTMDNAASMGLAGKDNWKKQPAVMLKWRAVSACARVVFPDVIQGMYTPEEMGAEVHEDESGNVIIDATVTPVIPIGKDLEELADITPLETSVSSVGNHTQATTTPEPAANPFGGKPNATQEQPNTPTWFNTPARDSWGVLKGWVLANIYNKNTFHMNGSLYKHGIVADTKSLKPVDAWANKPAGELIAFLEAERAKAVTELPEASGQ